MDDDPHLEDAWARADEDAFASRFSNDGTFTNVFIGPRPTILPASILVSCRRDTSIEISG